MRITFKTFHPQYMSASNIIHRGVQFSKIFIICAAHSLDERKHFHYHLNYAAFP